MAAGDLTSAGGASPEPVVLRVRLSAGRRPDPGSSPTLLCWTHVPAWSLRAGNEVRLDRLLRWIERQGWRVILVCCPLEGEAPNEEQFARLFRRHREAVLVRRDGSVQAQLGTSAASEALTRLDGQVVEVVEGGAGPGPESPGEKLAGLLQEYCPDVLVEVLRALEPQLRPRVLLPVYVFMTRALRFLPSRGSVMVDTHDLFSARTQKVIAHGVEDDLAMTAEQEAGLFELTDVAIAIQPAEADALRTLLPEKRVVTAGVDFPVARTAPWPREPVVLVVGSGNPANRKGLSDFLALAWPRVRRLVPDARLLVAGSVGLGVSDDEPGVEVLGPVDDLERAYRAARVVANPTVAGTGLKIKTVEALSHLRTVVTFASGAEGLDFELRRFCHVAQDWSSFSTLLARALVSAPDPSRLAVMHESVARELSPTTVYAELARELRRLR